MSDRTIAAVLYGVGAFAEVVAVFLLLTDASTARRALRHPDLRRIEGRAPEGADEAEAIVGGVKVALERQAAVHWTVATLLFGIVAGAAGNLVALYAGR